MNLVVALVSPATISAVDERKFASQRGIAATESTTARRVTMSLPCFAGTTHARERLSAPNWTTVALSRKSTAATRPPIQTASSPTHAVRLSWSSAWAPGLKLHTHHLHRHTQCCCCHLNLHPYHHHSLYVVITVGIITLNIAKIIIIRSIIVQFDNSIT